MKDGNYVGRGKRFFRKDGLWYPDNGGKPLALNDDDMAKIYKIQPVGMSPSTVDVSVIKEYGLTQKLSNSIRVF